KTYRLLFGWISKIIRPVKVLQNTKLKDDRVIYCINHTSNWDFVTVLESFDIDPICAYKEEFRKNKFLSRLFDSLGYVAVKRGEADINAIKIFMSALKQGRSLLIAPEGTRNKVHDGSLMPFKEGAVMLSIKTKTPIIPIYIYHPRNKKDKITSTTNIVVGKKVEFDDLYGMPLTKETLTNANQRLFEEFLNAKEICDKHKKHKKS
ncbi:MAG: 1-acyl-sn-glycerol-3-phosphate acyltransferase, partial [Clostridia bacterium]|nr:1-acyl-sn-glycerol-3-phosphate acyltransferase [Clostridia bacterium]